MERAIGFQDAGAPAYQFFMIPPFTHLQMVKEAIKDTDIK